jgi:ADP-ribosylglycohydrolase
MKRLAVPLTAALLLAMSVVPSRSEERVISRAELTDKVTGFWLGQLVGNYMGFPFENIYVEEPIPFLVDRYYTYQDDPAIRMNRNDLRCFIPILAAGLEGAISDDDTDIEFVTLHAVERHGLDINYDEITDAWKTHINRKIWVANRTARTLMDQGLVAPETGKKENNSNWFQIDPQLVNEIWSAFYPGMTARAAHRADWGARITNDDWGTHPTIAYAVMISAAFFEDDPQRLVAMAVEAVPNEGPFAEGMRDVVRWHEQYPDWQQTRQKIHEKYWAYKKGDFEAPVSVVSSLQNGLCGIMAVLYGEGDFLKTTGIAVSAGYDCDNQAATCAGLIGAMHGTSCIPDTLTKEFLFRGKWNKPFNDQYVNYSRDRLPIVTKISDLADRIVAISEQAILANGGKKEVRDGEVVYVVNCDF